MTMLFVLFQASDGAAKVSETHSAMVGKYFNVNWVHIHSRNGVALSKSARARSSLHLELDDRFQCVPACHSNKHTHTYAGAYTSMLKTKRNEDGNTEMVLSLAPRIAYSRRIVVVSIFRDITHETDKSHSVAINHFAEKLGDWSRRREILGNNIGFA